MADLSGQIVEGAKKADPRLVGSGHPDVDAHRTRMLKRSINRKSFIKKALRPLDEAMAKSFEGVSILDGRVDAVTRKDVYKTLIDKSDDAFGRAERLITTDLRRSMVESMRMQNAILRREGMPTLPESRIREVVQAQMRAAMDEEFPPGSGASLRTRFVKYRRDLDNKVNHVLERRYGPRTNADMVKGYLRSAVVGEQPRIYVPGGSTLKTLQRTMIAEQTRKANDAGLQCLGELGVAFARWNLSVHHPWYGGREICEVLASQVPDITLATLRRHGVNPSGLDLHGVYPLANWPSYPHPFCKCHPTPFFPPKGTFFRRLSGRIVGWFSR